MSFDESDGIKILLYGKSGTGKTTLWATFPAPILVMVSSGGMKPGELRSVNTKENRGRISQVTIENSLDIAEIMDHQSQTNQYKTVVLDHATGLQDRVLAEILGMDEAPVQKSWGLASQQQYGQVTAQCKEHFRRMLSLSANVVIIAQERTFQTADDVGESAEMLQPWVGAALTPSLAGWLGPACDYVCQTLIRGKFETKTVKIGAKDMPSRSRVPGVEYCLRTAPHDIFATKFRVPRGRHLPEFIIDPTYDKIMDLING